MAELPLNDAIPRLKANEARFDDFVNGDEAGGYQASDGTSVPSIRRFLTENDVPALSNRVDTIEDGVSTERERIDQILADAGEDANTFVRILEKIVASTDTVLGGATEQGNTLGKIEARVETQKTRTDDIERRPQFLRGFSQTHDVAIIDARTKETYFGVHTGSLAFDPGPANSPLPRRCFSPDWDYVKLVEDPVTGAWTAVEGLTHDGLAYPDNAPDPKFTIVPTGAAPARGVSVFASVPASAGTLDLTGNDDGDVIGASITGSRLRFVKRRRNLETNVDVDTLSSVDLAIAGGFAPGVTKVKQTMSHGQSNSIGSYSRPLYTLAALDPGYVKMFLGGIRGMGNEHSGGFRQMLQDYLLLGGITDAVEQLAGTVGGETGLVRYAHALRMAGALDATSGMLLSAHGIGATDITGLNKDTRPYFNLKVGALMGYYMAKMLGLEHEFYDFIFIWGEAAVGRNPYPVFGEVRDQILQFQADVVAMLRGINKQQATNPLMLMVQNSTWTNGLRGPASSPVPLDQLAAVKARPDDIILATAGYHHDCDGLHFSARGQSDIHQYIARVSRLKRLGGFTSLECPPVSNLSGDTITVPMQGIRGGGLVVGSSIVSDPGNHGFAVREYEGGPTVPLASVGLSTSNTAIEIKLAGGAPGHGGQRIECALTGNPATPGGPTSGPRCDIHDASPELLDDGRPMHQYPLHSYSNVPA